MNASFIDVHTFDELQARLGPAFVAELVAIFDTEAPRLLDEIQTAYQANSVDSARRASHCLEGDSRTFGALRLADALQRLKAADADRASALATVQEELQAARHTLRSLAQT